MFRWMGKSEDGLTVTIKRLEGCPITLAPYATPAWLEAHKDLIRVGAVVDVETTGLNQSDDDIIELALRLFSFHRQTGEILTIGEDYSSFQDPGRPISSEISTLTGITNDMVAGKNIDWLKVNQLLSECSVVIAHNAKFDRPFIDRKSTTSKDKIWACSYKHIDWAEKGFTSSKLELLNIYHGFFTDSHRAINDVDALLYLLSLPCPLTQKPYLFELLQNAKRPMVHVIASSSPFESKDHLKTRSYRWDNTNRFWSKIIFQDELPKEISWLEEVVYGGPFGGITRDIPLQDSFKA